jgi:hypothetical protein
MAWPASFTALGLPAVTCVCEGWVITGEATAGQHGKCWSEDGMRVVQRVSCFVVKAGRGLTACARHACSS